MKSKMIAVASMVGLILSARGAMGTTVVAYEQDFNSDQGSWTSPYYSWSDTVYIAYAFGHGGVMHELDYQPSPTGSGFTDIRAAFDGTVVPVSGNTLHVQFDSYQYVQVGVLADLILNVTFTDNSVQQVTTECTNPNNEGYWETTTQTYNFTKPMQSVEVVEFASKVYDTGAVHGLNGAPYGDSLAFDNILIEYTVPEPNVALLLVVGGGMLLARRRARS